MSVLAVIGTYRHRIDTIVCFSEGWKSGFVPCNFNKVQACTPPSFHFFFWAAWASGNDALRMRITAFFQSVCWRIIDFTRNQQGVLRVTRRLFGYCRKVAAARYVSRKYKKDIVSDFMRCNTLIIWYLKAKKSLKPVIFEVWVKWIFEGIIIPKLNGNIGVKYSLSDY